MMQHFLRSLLLELDSRISILHDKLGAIASEPELNTHIISTYQILEKTRRANVQLLNDPSLGRPELLSNHLGQYQRWAELVDLAEAIPIPLFERYNDADRQITNLCHRLAREINWPLPPPVVATFSSQYYWTNVGFNFICVPTVEGLNLLSLPDLCHEMGHILFASYVQDILGNFLQELAVYIQNEREQLARNQRPPQYSELYERLFQLWCEDWMIEFVADMIATYIAGPAYAWQHIRLCASRSGSVYHPTIADDEILEHPADEARFEGILAVLNCLNDTESISQVKSLWTKYVDISNPKEPAEYRMSYPPSLIENLAVRVVAGCKNLGVLNFSQTAQQDSNIVKLMQSAWNKFLTEPVNYLNWAYVQQSHLGEANNQSN